MDIRATPAVLEQRALEKCDVCGPLGSSDGFSSVHVLDPSRRPVNAVRDLREPDLIHVFASSLSSIATSVDLFHTEANWMVNCGYWEIVLRWFV